MAPELLIVILSLVAGVVGTGLGGVVGVVIKDKGNAVMGRVLGFAGGIMAGVVCFEMVPESVSYSADATGGSEVYGTLIAVASLIVGAVVIYGLNKLVDKAENMRAMHRNSEEIHHETVILENVEDIKEHKQGEDISDHKRALVKAGFIMFLAIALHNFPEGMAIGAGGAANSQLGIFVAIVIAIHNIPEGMAISAPLAAGGLNPWKTIGMTALAGLATVFGSVVGLLVGGVGPLALGICMGLAGGAMLYVTFGELLPESTLMENGRVPAVSMLIGIVCSMLLVYLFV